MKLAKILYTISIFVITGFVILFSMGCRLGIGTIMNPVNIGDSKNVSEEQETEPFKNIEVDANVVNFKIEEGDSYKVKTVYPSGFKTDIDVEGETLKVEVKSQKGFDLNVVGFGDIISLGDGLPAKRCDLTVVVPKDGSAVMEDIKIKADAGNVNLEDRVFDDINIECDAGNVQMKDIKSATCRIDTDAGNVQVSDCDLGDMDLKTDAGNIEFDRISMGDMRIKTNMGNIDLEGVTFGKGSVDSDVGNIEIEGSYDKLVAESDVGAINASSSKEDTVFDIKTQIGAVTVNGDSKGRSYSN